MFLASRKMVWMNSTSRPNQLCWCSSSCSDLLCGNTFFPMDLTWFFNGVRLVRWERWHSLLFNGGWWDKSHIILLIEEIRRSPVEGKVVLSHYLQGFIHLNWCRISSINSMDLSWDNDVRWDSSFFFLMGGWYGIWNAFMLTLGRILSIFFLVLLKERNQSSN